ncbi:hypothetical protein GOBAR_AA19849 [Gossypium barbadense]|uniref:Uncharacterized protein n=1 Tax=Gossypium barbadense TaxID=3634 RepID=A0A2P5XBV8_GOSBA|nr:hypothetical protein GOBAR_AA19849 [Gossypium barbadense]
MAMVARLLTLLWNAKRLTFCSDVAAAFRLSTCEEIEADGLVSHILKSGKLIKDASKFEKGMEWPLAMLGMAGMNLLNVFLGIDLFNAFKKEKKRHE